MLENITLYSLSQVEEHFNILKLANLVALSYTRVNGIETIRGIEELPKLIYLT